MQKRFPKDANTYEEAEGYLVNRSKQLLRYGFRLDKIEEHDPGKIAYFTDTENPHDKKYVAIYIYEDSRGENNYEKLKKQHCPDYPVITVDDCLMDGFLDYKGFNYHCITIHNVHDLPEYNVIEDYYGDQKAERSGVFYMNHIDEGLAVLNWLNASESAKRAYCLHPILQGDKSLLENRKMVKSMDPDILMLTMEYRNIANRYLSNDSFNGLGRIKVSPLPEVNQMLRADKIQNFKDFELYHKGDHERSTDLELYFRTWLQRLGIDFSTYKHYKNRLTFNNKV